ncbi:MAG: HD domain-containing protein [Halanaerobiales bacterium]|nr:HD domain-containing protein [Halanaerobiales bacterium]
MNKHTKIFLISLYILYGWFLYYTYVLIDSFTFDTEIIFFIVILIILMNLSMFYNYKSKVQTAIFLPALIPAIVIFNPFWNIIIATLGSVKFMKFKEGKLIWYKFIFNRVMLGLSAGISAYIFNIFYVDYFNNNIILSILIASIVYFIINNLLLFIVINLSEEKQEISFMVYLTELSKNIFVSYFLGLLLYFSYTQFGKLFFLLVIILIYIVKDFFFSRIQLLNSFTQVIESFLKVIDSKDHYTEGHCERVAKYTNKLCDAANVNQRKKERIVNMAKIHDIGKIYVDDEILKSEDVLSDEEFKEMKKHSKYGYELLKDIDMLNDDLEIILHHHEFYNGNGYPKGIKEKEIPLGSRILNICDSFDVMTTGRSYKKALNKEETIREFERCSGKQFDPELADEIIKLIKNGELDESFKDKNI